MNRDALEWIIELWIGGSSDAALKRAVAVGDGWHGTFMSPQEAAPLLKRLRAARPADEFVLSMRVAWDGLTDDADEMRRRLEKFRTLGLQHLLVSPGQPKLDAWLTSVETLAKVFEEFR